MAKKVDYSGSSPRLPADPPLELDGMPAAQDAWIKLAGQNAAVRMLDYDLVLVYALECEFLARFEGKLEHTQHKGERLMLEQLICYKKAAIQSMLEAFYPDGWENHA